MTTEEAKAEIFQTLINAQLGTYCAMYAPEEAVLSIRTFVSLIDGLTRYRARLALKELREEGLIKYTSQGRPAVESYGEYCELVCEAMPPLNGYALTDSGYETDAWVKAYDDWKESMRRWAEGDLDSDEDTEIF